MLETLRLWILPAVVLAVAGALGYLFRSFFVHRMAVLSQKTQTDLDDLIVQAVKRHIPLWFWLGGLVLAARGAPIRSVHHQWIDRIAAALFVVSLSLVAANLITGLVERATRKAGATFVSASLTRNVLRGAILIVGGLMVLAQLGVQIQPLLAALGVGSLAVALALQPTLSNLFAGLHITLAKPLRIGDFIELDAGANLPVPAPRSLLSGESRETLRYPPLRSPGTLEQRAGTPSELHLRHP